MFLQRVPSKIDSAPVWIIFSVLILTYMYFPRDSYDNGWSRLDLVRAIVEDRTTKIDRFQAHIGSDKSFFKGHYYSDKAPGQALLAVPAYALADGLMRRALRHTDVRGSVNEFPIMYLSTIVAVALPSALGAACFFVMARRLTGDPYRALFAAAALGLGSLAFPYSLLFIGHQTCGTLLFIAFSLLIIERYRSRDLAHGWRRWPVFIAGAAAGYATAVELSAAVPAAILGLYLIRVTRDWRLVLCFVLGALPCAGWVAIYNWVSFGSPTALGYQHLVKKVYAEGMSRGFMGLTYPRPSVLFQIVFGLHRGLVPLTPVVIIGAIGLGRMVRQKFLTPEFGVCVSVVFFYLLYNSSYIFWDGGNSFGPRFIVPMLAFLYLPLAFGLDFDWRLIPSAILALVSIAHMLMGAAVDPLNVLDFSNLYARFMDHGTWSVVRNFGMKLGLHGPLSLVPLIVIWLVAALLLITHAARTTEATAMAAGHAAP